MPNLPGNIARYDSVDLLDLDQVELYFDAKDDRYPKSRAKLNETERRWVMFDWATFVIHDARRNRKLFQDFAAAYVMSFESTLQVLLKERALVGDFEKWLRALPEYDVVCRGLRTLRHLEAHIQPGVFSDNHVRRVHSRFAHTATGGTIAWRWDSISSQVLASVQARNSKLGESELAAWNRQCEEVLALGIMRHGLKSLQAFVNQP